MPADVGTGTTIVFGTSSFSAEVTNLNGTDMARSDVETSHMGTTGYKTYIPGKLLEGGAVEMEISFDADQIPPLAAVAETVTVTFPVPTGKASGANVAFSGYINSWSWTDPIEDKMTAEVTVKVDGLTDPVWTVSST